MTFPCRITTTLATLICLTLASGCGAGDSATDGKNQATTSTSIPVNELTSTPSPSSPTNAVEIGTPTADEPRPDDVQLLAVLYSLLHVANAEESLAFLSMNVAEAEIAQCMSDAGFQHVAGAGPAELLAATPSPNNMPADEYAATYGLGITGWELGLYPPDLPDPNVEYRSSLSEGQRDAYNQTFFVCRGSTPERIARSNAWNIAVAQFQGAIAADDRVIDGTTVWRACMSAAGFIFDGPQAMEESFYARMNGGLSGDELNQLHTEEVATAIANVPCEATRRSTYRAVVLERFNEYKQLYDTALASGDAPDGQG